MPHIQASIPVLQWAARRAHLDEAVIEKNFPRWPQWLSGTAQPTLKQLESFAKKTHTSIGYFFLPDPPEVVCPISDFRTLRDEVPAEPSTELLDTLFLCQQRQQWFRNYSEAYRLENLPFVGGASTANSPEVVANSIRETLGLSFEEQRQLPTWTEALRRLIAKTEESGILVMVSSVVGSNNHRKLLVEEFRGFVLSDNIAPLIFLNGNDSKSAQMFTLAHELAHIWLGESGISAPEAGSVPEQGIERWCNSVAAEVLIPLDEMRRIHNPNMPVFEEIQRLARQFKVSTLVALRRLFEAGFINRRTLWKNYRTELERIHSLSEGSGEGGNFYHTLGARTSKRFVRALLASTLEGKTLFQDAFHMLGIRKTSVFYEAARIFNLK